MARSRLYVWLYFWPSGRLYSPLYPYTQLDARPLKHGNLAQPFVLPFSLWAVVMALILMLWVGVVGGLSLSLYPITLLSTLGLLLSASFQLVYHWDKILVLRLGKFHTVRGPGLFFLIPLVDRVAEFIDMRIRATDFSAEKTLTKDTVPVHVDALSFDDLGYKTGDS